MLEDSLLLLTGSHDDDCDDESVDTEDTGHDNWDDRLEEQLRLEHAGRVDADGALRRAVSCTEV